MRQLNQLPEPLLAWYGTNARVLPWRGDPTPYHVWVSEIMLQQTRVAAALGYYLRFMEALPDIAALAACPEEQLMKLWQGLGYYSRARNLQKTARIVADRYGGEFPRELSDILALPGIGAYTAGAIASIAFGQPVPAVDGNVLRVVSRLTADRREMGKLQVKREVASALKAVIPQDRPGDFNQALMDLGAMVCLPGGPACGKCPAAGFCAGFQQGIAGELPVTPAKKARQVQERVVYLIFREGKTALRRRPSKGLLAGLWEYPNEPAPWPCPVPGEVCFRAAGKHIFTHIEWRMTAYSVAASTPALPPGWVWASKDDLERTYAVPSAFAAFREIVDAGTL